MRRAIMVGVAILTAVLVLVIRPAWDGNAISPGASKAGQEVLPAAKPKITVSRQTTFITEPLTKGGYVDYLAALNAISSKGVTPENNAAVLLYQAVGPSEIPRPCRDQAARALGIAPLAETGKYLERFLLYARRKQPEMVVPASSIGLPGMPGASNGPQSLESPAESQFRRAQQRPWSKEEFPLVAGWLVENERPLDLIVAASRRPRYFFPPLTESSSQPLLLSLLPLAQQAREAARAISIRATFHLGGGKIDEAWKEVLACHRLARLVGQGPTAVEGMVGYAIDWMACQDDAAVAHYGRLSAEQTKRFAEELKTLPPLPKMRDKVTTGERFMFLDTVSKVSRFNGDEFKQLLGMAIESGDSAARIAKFAADELVDWDEPMLMGNAWFDRFDQAFARPTRAERDAALARVEHDATELGQKFKDPRYFLGDVVSSSPRRAAGREVGRLIVALLLPAASAAAKAEDRALMNVPMGQVAFALAAYRADHGEYPAELARLCPKYLAAVPEDLFGKSPLHYERTRDGYALWSVGPDGKDHIGTGRGKEDGISAIDDGDDIAIRMPVLEKK